MNVRDPHSALKSEIVATANNGNMETVVVKLLWGKEDSAYSLHVNPSSFTTAGIQKTDFLAYLGFQRNDKCAFTKFQRCFVKWIPENFDPNGFLVTFEQAFDHLQRASQALEACGYSLNQPEGWGFFYGKPNGDSIRGYPGISGDGHTARKIDSMKQTGDETFLYRFSFIETDSEKGFITHYRPKHPPLSSELRNVFRYLGLREFEQCAEFDFEPCFYRSMKFESRGESIFANNTEYAHHVFDAHEARFSSGIQELLAANEKIETFGMSFLPFEKVNDRLETDIEQKILRAPKPATNTLMSMHTARSGIPSNFDVAISVAGPDKHYADQLAKKLQAAGFSVFYYEFYPEFLWGKNLGITFDEIFRKRSRFCVMFVSQEYRDRVWTSHEMRSAQARAVAEKGNEYILPIRIDDVELDGLLPTISYVSIALGIERIGDILIKKLQT